MRVVERTRDDLAEGKSGVVAEGAAAVDLRKASVTYTALGCSFLNG